VADAHLLSLVRTRLDRPCGGAAGECRCSLADVERVLCEELCRWIEIPACLADLFFIEKCALALGTD